MIVNRKARREARQLFRLCQVGGFIDEELVRRVVRQAVGTAYRNRAPVLSEFHRLVRLDRARHTAFVESAAPVPAEIRSEIESALAHRYGPGLAFEFVAAPALIAGTRIRVGSDIYDGSLASRIEALQNSF